MDGWAPLRDTQPKLVTAAEFAAMLQVSEEDVRGWIAEGRLPSEPGPDGEPRLQITEERLGDSGPGDDGAAIQAGLVFYSAGSVAPEEIATRRRRRELQSLGYYDYDGPIDIDALVAALSRRLAAVVPDPARAAPDDGRVYGTDVVASVVQSGAGPPEEIIPAIAAQMMENASDRLADDTAEPWPARPGQFPGGFAPVGTAVGDGVVRMWWGDPDAPILELEPLALVDVLWGSEAS